MLTDPAPAPAPLNADLPTLDWQTPWFKPLQPWGPRVLALWQSGHALSRSLNQTLDEVHARVAWRPHVAFVPQEQLPKAMAYETFIQTHAQVPTREHMHDFFNAMSWCRWPQTKALISRLQGQAIDRQMSSPLQAPVWGPGSGELGIPPPARGLLRDSLTLIDESGVFLSCTDAMWQALCEHRWTDLFVTERAAWAQCHVHMVGHALLEKLMNPYKSITAQVLRVSSPMSPVSMGAVLFDQALWDASLKDALISALQIDSHEPLRVKPFQVLPLMGIPGWAEGQETSGYYEDTAVFRPRTKPLGNSRSGG